MDTPSKIAFDERAPADERFDAQSELQKSHMPTLASELLPRDDVREVIEWIENDLAEQALNKAIANNVVPFPPKHRGKPGMQSVYLDDFQVLVNGQFYEKPTVLGFEAMRAMVDQTPVLSGVIMTRIRQINRFCQINESGHGPGFAIRHVDRNHQLTEDEQQSIQLLQKFFQHCGWEWNPRRRKRLRRDNFSQFMAKLVRDTLTMDAAPIETEFKRDRNLGIDGLYAVDGATIRLCTEEGYNGNDEIFALQVVQGQVRSAYTHDDLIYEPRNPRSDVLVAGYGMGEVELLVRVVTGFLNAMTLNIKGFSENAIPRGLLHLSGNYSEKDLIAFRRYWNAMVKGINNAWTLPVLVSKDQESRASFENFGVDFNEMYFSKWMTFLASIICAIYGMDPAEINFESFSASKSALSGEDTVERLADSKDRGLRPLLSYFENIFTDFIVADFSDKYVFRWTGLDDEDANRRWEATKLSSTWNELRAMQGQDPIDGPLGEAPLNPSLIGPWLQMQQQDQQGEGPEDFGQIDEETGMPGDDERAQGDFGQADEDDREAGDFGQVEQDREEADQAGEQDAEALSKAFNLPPIYTLDP